MLNLRKVLAPTVGLLTLGVGLGTACQREDPDSAKALKHIADGIDQMNKSLDQIKQGGGMRGVPSRAGMRRPGMPNPATVYAVPIEGDPVWGPASAPVTLVAAEDFA